MGGKEGLFTEEQQAVIKQMIAEAVADALDEAMAKQGELASQSAARAMLQEITRNRKERYDKRLRNTKLLLRNYRMLKSHIAEAVYDTTREREALAEGESLYDVMNAFGGERQYIESIRKSVRRTRLIMTHVDSMLEVYRVYCEQSQKQEAARHYRVLHALYIADKTTTPQEIADKEHIETRTVYRDIDAAAEILTPLFFGVDGIKTDF